MRNPFASDSQWKRRLKNEMGYERWHVLCGYYQRKKLNIKFRQCFSPLWNCFQKIEERPHGSITMSEIMTPLTMAYSNTEKHITTDTPRVTRRTFIWARAFILLLDFNRRWTYFPFCPHQNRLQFYRITIFGCRPSSDIKDYFIKMFSSDQLMKKKKN